MAFTLCYSRYLGQFSSLSIADISRDINQAQQTFLPAGLDSPRTILTLRALLGEAISRFFKFLIHDPRLQNSSTVMQALKALQCLRVTTQIILKRESLYWLLYNGVIHIYNICRLLMRYDRSDLALEYMLWACLCIESVLPLMSTKYLPWRTTLYLGVCQCYFDLKLHHNAELFAKRGISKINDLMQLEQMSALGVSNSNTQIFKEALIKMNLMIFRRLCVDSRRKSKGQLRPRLKQNLSDIKNQAWPRTSTERLLSDTFTSSSAHFLAILEGLQYYPHRRTLQIGSVSYDADEFEVYNELFFAGLEILYNSKDKETPNINIINHIDYGSGGASQLTLACKGIVYSLNFIKIHSFNCQYLLSY